jgi:hypothetical protein
MPQYEAAATADVAARSMGVVGANERVPSTLGCFGAGRQGEPYSLSGYEGEKLARGRLPLSKI